MKTIYLPFSALIFLINIQTSASILKMQSQNFCADALNGMIERNEFNVVRGFHSGGAGLLPKQLHEAILKLHQNEIFLDLGAGLAQGQCDLIEDYETKKTSHLPTMIALGVHRETNPIYQKQINRLNAALSTHPQTLTYVDSKLSDLDIDQAKLRGKVSLINNYQGALNYTLTLKDDLMKSLDMLKMGGQLYLAGGLERTIILSYNNKNNSGFSQTLEEWLLHTKIAGIKTEKFSPDPIHHGIVITKLADNIQLPHLQLIDLESNNPPYRSYVDYHLDEIEPYSLLGMHLEAKEKHPMSQYLNYQIFKTYIKTDSSIEAITLHRQDGFDPIDNIKHTIFSLDGWKNDELFTQLLYHEMLRSFSGIAEGDTMIFGPIHITKKSPALHTIEQLKTTGKYSAYEVSFIDQNDHFSIHIIKPRQVVH